MEGGALEEAAKVVVSLLTGDMGRRCRLGRSVGVRESVRRDRVLLTVYVHDGTSYHP